MGNKDLLILIDYSWLLNRCHWGYSKHPSCHINIEGEKVYIGSILGLSLFTEKVSKKYPEAKIVFIMDGKCTKKTLNEDYKAGRVKKEDVHVNDKEIINILSNVPKVYFAINDKQEADDLIASMAYKFKDTFKEVIIHSGDCDFWQLSDTFTVSKEYEKGFKKIKPIDVLNKFGVDTQSLLAFRVLDGDSSDNLPKPVSRVKTEFKVEISDKWKDDLTIDNFTEIMYSYRGTPNEKIADKYLEAIDTVETNLLIMDLKKYSNPELQLSYNMTRIKNPDRSLISYYKLSQLEGYMYDLSRKKETSIG